MYEAELTREARLIVRGYEEYLRDLDAVWASIRTLFSFGTRAPR